MTTTPERREQIGAFFTANATRMHNTVRAAARGPEPVIEDACQAAWTILLRRPDVTLDDRGLSWLATVAIREAWRQASTARETPAGGFQGTTSGHADELPEPAHPDDRSAEQRALERIEHNERVQALATLKPREREALYLHGLGHSYVEVAKATGSTYTAVISRRLRQRRGAGGLGHRRHVADRGEAEARVSSSTSTRPLSHPRGRSGASVPAPQG